MRRKMLIYAVGTILMMLIAGVVTFLVLSDPVEQKMQRAYELRENGNHTAAAEDFHSISQLHPQTRHADEALFESAFTYYIFDAHNSSESSRAVSLTLAENAFKRLINEYPESRFVQESLLKLAQIKTSRQQYAEANEYFERAGKLIDDPVRQQEVLFSMAQNLERLGKRTEAEEKLREVIAIDHVSDKLENAYLTIAEYYETQAQRMPVDAQDAYGAIVELLLDMLRHRNLSTNSRGSALKVLAKAYFELDAFERCEQTLQLLENLGQQDNTYMLDENYVDLIADYRQRIKQLQQMGR